MPRLSAAAQVQRRLWGTDPRAWAELAQAHNQPLFEAGDAAKGGPVNRPLDVGRARPRPGPTKKQAPSHRPGCQPRPPQITGDRLPDADLREGDTEYLPFGDATFDAVTGINAFQFAGDPQKALREAARVTRPGGRVVASLFAAPERSQGTVVHWATNALIPPRQAADHAPYLAVGTRRSRSRPGRSWR